jgi:hypothetical protein
VDYIWGESALFQFDIFRLSAGLQRLFFALQIPVEIVEFQRFFVSEIALCNGYLGVVEGLSHRVGDGGGFERAFLHFLLFDLFLQSLHFDVLG